MASYNLQHLKDKIDQLNGQQNQHDLEIKGGRHQGKKKRVVYYYENNPVVKQNPADKDN